jgi:hypothetical protein
MPVTPRSLRRRLRNNPAAVKVGAGVLASAIGMTTAAYGVLHIVVPFKGNGARSDVRPASEEPSSPQADLVNTLLALVPTELPAEDGSDALASFSLDGTGALVTSVVDSVNGSANEAANPGSGGGGTGGGGGNGGLFDNFGDGPTWTPPGGGGDEQGLDAPSLSQLTPGITAPDLALEGEEECPAAEDGTTEEPSAIDPHLPGLAPETAPACEDEEAPAEEEATAEEAPAAEEQAPEAPGQRRR